MVRIFTAEERLRNVNASMFHGTMGGTIRASHPARRSLTVPTGAIRSAGTGISGVPTIFIAASDAPDVEKAMANYVCFGDASDTDVIQNAIWDDVNAFGDFGRVLLSHGTFEVTQLLLTDGLTLEGLGYDTVLHQPDNQDTNNWYLSPDGDYQGVTIRNMRLDGNQANQPTPTVADGGQVAIPGFLSGFGGTTIDSLWVHDWSFVGIWAPYSSVVTNCHAWDCGQDGLIDDRATYSGVGFQVTDSNVSLVSCSATHCQLSGFAVDGGSHVTLNNCEAVDCGYNGSDSDAYAQSSYAGFAFSGQAINGNNLFAYDNYHGVSINGGSGTLSNSRIEDSTANGMYLSGLGFNLISGNKIVNAAKHGIYALSPSSFTIQDNLLDSNGDSTHDNIQLAYNGVTAGVQNTIINNRFTSGPRYHINVANANISNTWIGMNDLRPGAGTARINNTGTATITNPGNWGIDF